MKIVSLHLHCRVIDVGVIIEHGVGGIVAPLLLRHRERRYIKRNTLGGVVVSLHLRSAKRHHHRSLHLRCCVIDNVVNRKKQAGWWCVQSIGCTFNHKNIVRMKIEIKYNNDNRIKLN